MEKTVLVIGHRNPDTDSVCSAIAYAYLKQQLGLNAVPARAGKINPETQFVLEHFGVPVPKLVDDLYPRLSDIRLAQPPTVGPDASLRDVGRLFVEYEGLKSVPVLDLENNIVGIISVGDLAKRYYNELSIQDLDDGETDYRSIVHTLDGQLICGDLTHTFNGKIKIGASEPETLSTAIKNGDLVIIGDRVEAQLAVLEAGAAGLILTRDTEITPIVLQTALRYKAVVISTPYDTYTTARLINQSIQVRLVMTKNLVTLKTTDLLSDVREKMLAAKFVSYPVLERGKYVGMMDRGMMLVPDRQEVILVDHNERSQAVEGIEEAHLLEIIDHHRLGGLTTGAPIFIRQEPVGSTATIVANLTWHRGIELPPALAGILFAAIVSDTLYFRSPTATLFDQDTAKRLAEQAGIEDAEAFAMEVLRHGSAIGTMPVQDIVRNDIKEFDFGEHRITVSQINIMDRQQALERLGELQKALNEFRKQEGYDLSLLMVTDILGEATDLLAAGSPQTQLVHAFGEAAAEGCYHLPGVLSRKKQIIPPLTEAFRKQD